MRIELERDDFAFTNLSGPYGTHRALIVRIAGKPFFTSRTVESSMERLDPRYAEHLDKILIESMAHILTKVLEKACLEVPEGVELLTPDEDRIITAKANDAMHGWMK